VFGHRNSVKLQGRGLPDQFFWTDGRAAGVIIGVEVEVENHHSKNALNA
jgi:hypothetical protein